MPDVDEVIQRYSLDDKYSEPVKKMIQTTLDVGNVIQDAVSLVEKLGQSLFGIAQQAVEASAGLETTRTIMTALSGSAEKANKQLDFLRQLAKGSTLSFKDTQEAGRQLDEYGLSITGFGKTIAELAAVNPSQGIGGITRLLGRIAEGGGLAKRQLTAFGLSLQDFQKRGIQFRGETLLSSTKETLEAFRNIVESKYGKVLDGMQDTTAVKLKNVKDDFTDVLTKIGNALTTLLKPALDNLSLSLERLQNGRGFQTFLTNISKSIVTFVGQLVAVSSAILAVAAIVKIGFGDLAGGVLALIASASVLGAGAYYDLKLAKYLKDLTKQAKLPGLKNALPEGSKDIGDTSERIARNTAQTAVNTARALDLKKIALGGGPLGELGVTPVEFYKTGRLRSHNISITVNGLDSISDIVQHTVQQMLRQGVFPIG